MKRHHGLPVAALVLLFVSSAANAETIAGRASIINADRIEITGEQIRLMEIN